VGLKVLQWTPLGIGLRRAISHHLGLVVVALGEMGNPDVMEFGWDNIIFKCHYDVNRKRFIP
jgi:hypothetical protein